jgi:hypothetical protein
MDRRDGFEVVAAGFREPGEAAQVAARLLDAFDLDPDDLSVDELGGTAEAEEGLTVVLAGRFRHNRLPVVSDVVERHGGVVLVAIPEASTRRAGAGAAEPI